LLSNRFCKKIVVSKVSENYILIKEQDPRQDLCKFSSTRDPLSVRRSRKKLCGSVPHSAGGRVRSALISETWPSLCSL